MFHASNSDISGSLLGLGWYYGLTWFLSLVPAAFNAEPAHLRRSSLKGTQSRLGNLKLAAPRAFASIPPIRYMCINGRLVKCTGVSEREQGCFLWAQPPWMSSDAKCAKQWLLFHKRWSNPCLYIFFASTLWESLCRECISGAQGATKCLHCFVCQVTSLLSAQYMVKLINATLTATAVIKFTKDSFWRSGELKRILKYSRHLHPTAAVPNHLRVTTHLILHGE